MAHRGIQRKRGRAQAACFQAFGLEPMIRLVRWLLGGSTLLLTLVAGAPAGATVLFDWNTEELTRRADLVVIATVISKQSFAAGRTVMTTTKLRVERVLLGAATDELEIQQLGGRLGPRVVDVPGDAELSPGGTYLLFTAQPPGQLYRSLVGMGLGALRVEGEELRQTVEVPLLDPSGALLPPPGTRTSKLRAVEALIRGTRR